MGWVGGRLYSRKVDVRRPVSEVRRDVLLRQWPEHLSCRILPYLLRRYMFYFLDHSRAYVSYRVFVPRPLLYYVYNENLTRGRAPSRTCSHKQDTLPYLCRTHSRNCVALHLPTQGTSGTGTGIPHRYGYRGTSLKRKRLPLGPYRCPGPREGPRGWAFSHDRTPLPHLSRCYMFRTVAFCVCSAAPR